MSKLDSTHSLDPEESAEMLDMFNDMSFHAVDAKLTNGFTRQRSISKLKAPPRRDSQTLPWRSNSVRASRTPASDTGNKSSKAVPKRPDSPDIETILASTPRPRKSSSSSLLTTPSRTKSSASVRKSSMADAGSLTDDKSFTSVSSDFGTLLEDGSGPEEGDGETDSSLDIHTPLPHLMFRDGLLSPRSKLLPQSSPYPESGGELHQRAGSAMSLASTVGSTTTKQRLQRDPRDTVRRRLRHRDGSLLKAGMGLTTGLGWSDSEDEDAPSLLTRRLINSTLEQRKRSGSVTSSMSSPSRVASPTSSVSMSRIASPVPSAKSVLSRKAISNSNLRSASVSLPTRQTSTPSSGPGAGMRIPRGRSVSTATHMSSLASASSAILSSHPKPAPSVLKGDKAATKEEEEPHSPSSPMKTPTSGVSPRLSRVRTDSTASSATTQSLASTTSTQVSSSDHNKAITGRLSSVQMPRPRTDSSTSASASTASLASTYSQYSQVSSSTASSSSVVPRPLRLLQSAGLKMPPCSFSQDIAFPSAAPPPVKEKAAEIKYQRLRTLSDPRSETVAPVASIQQSLAMSQPMRSGVLPPGSPPTLRQRQTPNGARPRPRTGTGMIYRTSSYSNYTSFHESVARIRETSAVPSSDGAFHAL